MWWTGFVHGTRCTLSSSGSLASRRRHSLSSSRIFSSVEILLWHSCLWTLRESLLENAMSQIRHSCCLWARLSLCKLRQQSHESVSGFILQQRVGCKFGNESVVDGHSIYRDTGNGYKHINLLCYKWFQSFYIIEYFNYCTCRTHRFCH